MLESLAVLGLLAGGLIAAALAFKLLWALLGVLLLPLRIALAAIGVLGLLGLLMLGALLAPFGLLLLILLPAIGILLLIGLVVWLISVAT